MNGFSDQLMIRYLVTTQVQQLLEPPDDLNRKRLQSLLASVYDPSPLEVRFVDSVEITATHFQVPVSAPVTVRGTWEKLLPDVEQSRAVVEIPAVAPPLWIDLVLDTVVTARVALNEGALESFSAKDLSGLSQTDFASNFAFLDPDELSDLLARAKVANYEELQAEWPRLYKLVYAQPPPFDPTVPGRTYPLRVSVLFFPDLDLEGVLRRLAQSRQALDDTRPHAEEYDGGALLAASAWLAVFPAAALASPTAPGNAQQVSDLLANIGGSVAAFETFP
ncbi:hypothetical protein P3T36_000983 [Kitasatospora sp. MAP12-15]|uniref:hypothetical protein n=1 Tax=unclassified Kitasatospora TaxID=2633591 RepID=UPI00247505D4|nr:hypothetical protein [Kitasatospora sp. MAP12-44]MDH6114584.1 hypothetical protein [Kitasatospora sp. MAP12-44]